MPNKMLPEGWNKLTLEECIDSDRLPKKPSIPQRDYQPLGKYPVVDQGAELIAGYCDVDTAVYRDHLPLILFGDHTRIFKFLDFPFATGADGTKLLKPNSHIVEPLFLYYALRNIDLPSRGYNRHFRILREQVIRAPTDRDEQKRIAWFLKTIEDSVEVESAICDKLAALKSATMAKLFREGLRGEPLKQTEIGEIPESWEVVRVGDIARITTGTTPSTDEPEYYVGDIPFVKTAEIDGQVITTSAVKVSQRAVHDYGLKLYPPGTVLLAMYGQGKTRGRTALLGVTAATTQNTAAIECLERLIPTYLWYWLDSHYEDLRGMGNLGHLSHLNLGYVKHLLVPLPDLTEQEEIANSVDLIRKRLEVAKGKRNLLAELFRIMLHSLMTGAIRVKDLDPAEVGHA